MAGNLTAPKIAPPLQVLGTAIKEKTARARLFYRAALPPYMKQRAKVLLFFYIRKQIAKNIANFRFTAFSLRFNTFIPLRNFIRLKRTQTRYVRVRIHINNNLPPNYTTINCPNESGDKGKDDYAESTT